MSITHEQTRDLKILVGALATKVLPEETARLLRVKLIEQPEIAAAALAIARNFGKPELTRSLNLAKSAKAEDISLEPDFHNTQVSYQGQVIGQVKILFKSPLPGELQARLAIESAIDRFLEYLQKVHQIVELDESDRHVQVFIPNQSDNPNPDLAKFWVDFIEEVAFSTYGLPKLQLPGLAQTFISMLKSVTLSRQGFSTLEVPILNRGQANVLAAWYFGVWRDAKKRQDERQKKKINVLTAELENPDLSEKDRKSKAKQLQDAEAMQLKEAEKYTNDFQKSFSKSLSKQDAAYQELESIQSSIDKCLSKSELKKLQKQQEKISEKLIFSQESVRQKIELLKQSGGNPLELVERDREQHPEKFRDIAAIASHFDKTATDQISGTRGDIFAKCITEMYLLMEMTAEQFDLPPPPLLTEHPIFQVRSPGDDSKEFCYSCGVVLDPKTAKWQVRRLIFESPEQRRQSASGEGRPHICSSCSAVAFASPLKVSDESIVLRLEPTDGSTEASLKLKDYLRMLTNKEMHLSAGRYIVLASEKTQARDSAAQKMGQVQYARTKAASIFPREVLNDFKFYLIVQGTEIPLLNRHLIFIKGLLEGYGQSIIIAGKEVNKILGDAVRYVEQDLPILAEYILARNENSFIIHPELEQVRAEYYQKLWRDVGLKEANKTHMNVDNNGQS
jgi:hypothetical protein